MSVFTLILHVEFQVDTRGEHECLCLNRLYSVVGECLQAGVYLYKLLALQIERRMATGDNQPSLDAQIRGLRSNTEFQPREPPFEPPGHNSLSPIAVDKVTGGAQCCDHIGLAS